MNQAHRRTPVAHPTLVNKRLSDHINHSSSAPKMMAVRTKMRGVLAPLHKSLHPLCPPPQQGAAAEILRWAATNGLDSEKTTTSAHLPSYHIHIADVVHRKKSSAGAGGTSTRVLMSWAASYLMGRVKKRKAPSCRARCNTSIISRRTRRGTLKSGRSKSC